MKINFTIIYYCLLSALLYCAWLIFKSIKRKNRQYIFRKPKIKIKKNDLDNINNIFLDAGFNITLNRYNQIRIILLMFFTIISSVNLNHNKLRFVIGFILLLYIISSPVKKFGKKDSPFILVMRMIISMQNKKKDAELYRILIQLKNIAITQQDKPYSGDYIINQLIKFAKLTKSSLINFLMYYNLGKEDEAFKKFTQSTNTKMGNEIGIILLKLDKLNPIELVEQIDIVKERTREKHITEKHRRQNIISDFIYLPIIIPVFVLFLNFIMITVWIPKIETMNLFG
ncbi:MAG: hypothetical protein N4A63_15655 [Vallitalea sp.]|jgi:hypothetical protein|nr:hypothetical protein [Vallitalea sp.]